MWRHGLRLVRACATLVVALVLAGPAAAADRLTLFDLGLGKPVADLPLAVAFNSYACGSNGGPPANRIADFSAYRRCPPEADGVHEVYFEYDDEAEYVARALDDYAAGWEAGTQIDSFPVTVSALFDDNGTLVGLRIVTDPRPEQRNDPFLHFRPRNEHYLLELYLRDRFGIERAECRDIAPDEGQGAVLGMFVHHECAHQSGDTRYTIESRLFRRPGETDVDPVTGQLTQGDFVSETRAELRWLGARRQ